MCVAFWSLTHPDYAVILCSNRDEFLARPTAPLHFHSFDEYDHESKPADEGSGSVLSGRDLQAGGTWLGINRAGRLAILTNITEADGHYPCSRGRLLRAFLSPPPSSPPALDDAIAALTHAAPPYAGFNLLLLAPERAPPAAPLSYAARLVTNGGGGGPLRARPLSAAERRCGGMSNGVDGDGAADWPKVVRGTALLSDILRETPSPPSEASEAALVARLFALLSERADPPPASRGALRTSICIPPLEVGDPPRAYGTRLASVVLVRRDGRVLFVERDVAAPAPGADRVVRFRVGESES